MTNVTKIALIFLAFTLITSCNSVKRLSDEEYLLKENTIIVNNEKSKDQYLYSYIHQRPNTSSIALYIYNKSDPDFEKTYEEYIQNHPKTNNFVSAIFSEKQVRKVYDFNVAKHRFYTKNGDAPVIVNDKRTEKSVKSLKKYYENKGYFNVEVRSEKVSTKPKKKKVVYHITTNKPYFLDSIKTEIETQELQVLYNKHKNASFIRKGQQFDGDNFKKEQNRLTKLFRNAGYYYFDKDYIRFDINRLDTTSFHNAVTLKISNQLIDHGDSISTKNFRVQKIKNVNVYTDYSFNTKDKPYKDSISYNGFTFFSHDKLAFSPKYLSNAMGISPQGVYKDTEYKLTQQYLNDLKVFRSPITIKYEKIDQENLSANILLTPLKKMGLSTQVDVTHANIKPFGVLGKFSFIDRNVFKGSEILDLSFQGSFLNVAEDASDPDFNFFGLTSWEFGANASFKIPRIFFPFNTSKLIPKTMRPKTTIGISTSFQKNIGLDRQNLTGNITYNWRKGKKLTHQFDLLNIQYINNINANNYFDVFGSELIKLSTVAQTIIDPATMNTDGQITDTDGYINHVLNPFLNYDITNPEEYTKVRQVKERKNIITEDVLVPTMSYAFTYDTKKGLRDHSFSFLRAKIVSAGSITGMFTKNNSDDRKVLFGLPIAQYIKTEVEYKKYWNFFNNNHLVFRTFVGAAVPFGNSSEIPFSRSYRAGGSNDIRAWRTFDLGPGSSVSSLDFNIGNLKLVSNLEYRFKIVNSFYGAAFVDAGNVWDLTNSELTSADAKFNGFNSFKDIAVGSGIGIRYDLTFLIFRTDYGFKTYEPYLSGQKWFRNYNFSSGVFNFGINYPF